MLMYREEEEEEQRERPTKTLRKTEKRSIDEVLSSSNPRNRMLKSPIVTQLPPPVPTGNLENSSKRRTTRRTTIRVAQDNANGKQSFSSFSHRFDFILAQPPSIEIPNKTRYPTRYSTRLAGTMIYEEVTNSTTTRRTTRLTSE